MVQIDHKLELFQLLGCKYELVRNDEDCFNPEDNSVNWSPRDTVMASNEEYNSPAICLMHELVHAYVATTKEGKMLYAKFMQSNGEKLSKHPSLNPKEEFAVAIEQYIANH